MFRFLLAALLGGTMVCARAQASTVVIWPVDPVIAGDKSATALWLENKGTEEVILQVRCLGWDQRSGEDTLSPQDEIVASPPLARVAPGARQMVRLIRRGAPPAAGEQAYRVLVDELPPPVTAATATQVSARLSVQMRYSIPLFTYPGADEAGAPRLGYRLVEGEGGGRVLELRNSGARHARLTDLRSAKGSAGVPLRPGLAGYVLAGATVRWPLPANVAVDAPVAGVNGSEHPIAPTP